MREILATITCDNEECKKQSQSTIGSWLFMGWLKCGDFDYCSEACRLKSNPKMMPLRIQMSSLKALSHCCRNIIKLHAHHLQAIENDETEGFRCELDSLSRYLSEYEDAVLTNLSADLTELMTLVYMGIDFANIKREVKDEDDNNDNGK